VSTYEPSEAGTCVRMVRDTDPYVIPVTSIRRHNRLPAGYANRSLRTCLDASRFAPKAAVPDEPAVEQSPEIAPTSRTAGLTAA
jgi:hypothetical protein